MRWTVWVVAGLALGCGGSTDEGLGGTGAKAGAGGATTGGSGGAITGGSGGATTGGSGGAITGGSGGATTGGSGGTATGGSGGTATGGSGGATTGGSGGATTGGSGGTATGGSGGTATGGGGGTGGSVGCSTACGLNTCCGDKCVNTDNDIKNCGSCGKVCPGTHPFCDMGSCKATPPCDGGIACIGTKFCCGSQCCDMDQLCCDVPASVSMGLKCVTPVGGTCPMGCKGCACNSPDTPIATPAGERAIETLCPGDLVYSVHRGALRAVPVSRVVRQAAPNHVVVEVRLASGATLHVSPAHPTADGRSFGELRAGDQLDGVAVVGARLVPFRHAHTVDILPESDTGTYYAGGVLIGSTVVGAGAATRVSGAALAPVSR
jgi:hypothetical protein